MPENQAAPAPSYAIPLGGKTFDISSLEAVFDQNVRAIVPANDGTLTVTYRKGAPAGWTTCTITVKAGQRVDGYFQSVAASAGVASITALV